jgi:O-antigen/teichoic acid export membrane protein
VTETAKAAREAGIYAYSRVAASLLVVLMPVIGTRIYSKTELAFVVAIALLHEAAMAIGSLGLADAVFYFIGRDPDGARRVVRQTSTLLLAFALPACAGMAIAGTIMSDHELNLVPSLPWLALVLVIELPTQPSVNQMIASGHARVASGLFVGFVILRTIALLLPGVLGIEVTWVPIIMAFTGLTRLAAHLIIVRGVFPMRPGENRREWVVKARFKEIMVFALPAGAALIAGKINPHIDKFAAKVLLGTEALAEYGVAAFELPLVSLVPYAVAAVMQARYVRLYMNGDIVGLRGLWMATVRKTALLVVPLSMMTIAVGYDLVIVLSKPAYADAALPFRILTIVLLHRIAAYSSILQAVNQTRAVMISSIFLITSNMLLTWPLTLLFGYPGPALASLFAVTPAFLYVLWRIGSVLGGGIRGALPWGFYFRVLLLGGAVALVTWLAVKYGLAHQRPGIRLAAGAFGYIALFVPAGRLLGLVERGDVRYLSQWLTLQMLRKEPAEVEKEVTSGPPDP